MVSLSLGLLVYPDLDHRWPDGGQKKPDLSGALERNLQVQNWGRPSGGADFVLASPAVRFKHATQGQRGRGRQNQ